MEQVERTYTVSVSTRQGNDTFVIQDAKNAPDAISQVIRFLGETAADITFISAKMKVKE